MKNYLTGLLMLGVTLQALAQQTVATTDTLKISLKEAWLRAEGHSRHIKVKQLEVGISAEEVKDLKIERLPEVQFKGTAEKASNMPIYENGLFSKPSQHEIIHTLYRAGVDFYLNLYNGNKLNLKIKEEKTIHEISEIKENQAVSDIHYKTAALYLDLQQSIIFKNLIKEDIEDQKKQLQEIKALLKNGVVLKSDVLRVELELSRREMALITIENDILIATQKLNIVMGTPDEQVVVPDAPFERWDKNAGYNDYLQLALEHSFDYHISEHNTAISKINLKQIKANVRPKIGIYSEYYYANPQIFLFPYNPSWYSLGVVGLKATFNISSLYHNVHKVRAAKIKLEKEEELHKNAEDVVRQQVKEAYLRYQEALDQIKVAEVNEAHASENARIIKNTYFNQTSLVTDLLDADVQLLQTKFDLAAAKIMAQNKYYLLQNIIGIL